MYRVLIADDEELELKAMHFFWKGIIRKQYSCRMHRMAPR